MDLSLLITIGLIFLVTLIGAYVRSIRRDPCLKSFIGFHVTLERANNKVVWGWMRLESTGLELVYRDAIQDEKHIESSYLLYASEYGDIQAIYRYADELSDEDRKKRNADIQRSFHPGTLRRLTRKARNFLTTATDSLNEVFNLLLGRVQKTGGRYITDGGNAALSKLGGQVLGQVGGTYDPLLEQYIGQRVVVEVQEGDEVHEHVGIFKNYSPDFIEVLDVQFPQRQIVSLSPEGTAGSRGPDQVAVSLEDDTLQVTNLGVSPVLLRSLEATGADEHLINAVVDGGETISLYPGIDLAGRRLNFQVVRELDMIVPRTRCVIRHRAENYKPEALKDLIFDIIFDVGVALSWDRVRDTREARLREELARDPKNALAAANLGCLLIQKQAFAEAEKWLQAALEAEHSLPDAGRRVRMELRELQRRT